MIVPVSRCFDPFSVIFSLILVYQGFMSLINVVLLTFFTPVFLGYMFTNNPKFVLPVKRYRKK